MMSRAKSLRNVLLWLVFSLACTVSANSFWGTHHRRPEYPEGIGLDLALDHGLVHHPS
jgi:hypothetical protein